MTSLICNSQLIFQLGTVTLAGWLVGGKSCLSRVCPRYKYIDVWFSQRAGFLLLQVKQRRFVTDDHTNGALRYHIY